MIEFRTIEYKEKNNELVILDQTKLPEAEVYEALHSAREVHDAIKDMKVRGAPLIGVAAAYGVVQAARDGDRNALLAACDLIESARPTAVNLSWAIARMKAALGKTEDTYGALLQEARQIEKEDKNACMNIGLIGAELVQDRAKIMVHCNAGALATSGIGTALGIIYTAKQQGKRFEVYSSETRPLLQGARLTSWELTRNGIETYTICDNMVASFMPDMNIVLVGADRIAGNGDVANKIGTRGLAIIAKYYNKPFYVAAPVSTFDFRLHSGEGIPIEERNENEIRIFNEREVVASSAKICNPAFDVTPCELITGIVTERCLLEQPYDSSIAELR